MLVIKGICEDEYFFVKYINIYEDSFDIIRTKIAKKISKILDKDIKKEDFDLWEKGEYINNHNYKRILLKEHGSKIISKGKFDEEKLFRKSSTNRPTKSSVNRPRRILRIHTDQLDLNFDGSDISRVDVDSFIDGTNLILKLKYGYAKLNLIDDMVTIKLKIKDLYKTLNLVFVINGETIIQQLYDYLNIYELNYYP